MRKVQLLAVVGVAAAAGSAMAAGTSFGSATVVDGSSIPTSTPAVVSGALDASGNQAAVLGPESVFQTFVNQQRVAGSINSFSLTGLPVGGVFRATMRNAAAPNNGDWDSYLRIRNSANTTTLASDDDSGPGALSSITTPISVPSNGEALVQVTGYTDRNSFTGTGSETGFYDLDILQRSIQTPAQYGVNVQWWRFENLVAGAPFSAEAIAASFPGSFGGDDTIMAAFDSMGAFLGSDDDGAPGSSGLSMLTGTIPGDGVVYIAVSSYQNDTTPDAGQFVNENANTRSGPMTIAFIPAPGSMALLGLGGLIAGRRRRA